MRYAVLILAIASALACNRKAPTEEAGSTRTTGGTVAEPSTRITEAVRDTMRNERPNDVVLINSLSITQDGSTVVLSGVVPDEATRDALIKAANDTPGAKVIRDDLKIQSHGPTTTPTLTPMPKKK